MVDTNRIESRQLRTPSCATRIPGFPAPADDDPRHVRATWPPDRLQSTCRLLDRRRSKQDCIRPPRGHAEGESVRASGAKVSGLDEAAVPAVKPDLPGVAIN